MGSVLVATCSACLAYLVIQFLWRRKVRSDWRERQLLRIRHRRATRKSKPGADAHQSS